MENERRRHPRLVLTCPARILRGKKLLVRGKTVDISAGGVKILGPVVKPPKVGDEVAVEIELKMPDDVRTREIQRSATVRRVEALGEWTSVSLEFKGLVELD